jgi:hypothetical protein
LSTFPSVAARHNHRGLGVRVAARHLRERRDATRPPVICVLGPSWYLVGPEPSALSLEPSKARNNFERLGRAAWTAKPHQGSRLILPSPRLVDALRGPAPLVGVQRPAGGTRRYRRRRTLAASRLVPGRRAGIGRSGSGGRLVTFAGEWFGGLTLEFSVPGATIPAFRIDTKKTAFEQSANNQVIPGTAKGETGPGGRNLPSAIATPGLSGLRSPRRAPK